MIVEFVWRMQRGHSLIRPAVKRANAKHGGRPPAVDRHTWGYAWGETFKQTRVRELDDALRDQLFEHGATRVAGTWSSPQYELSTRGGMLTISLSANGVDGGYDIFCRFEDPAKAKQVLMSKMPASYGVGDAVLRLNQHSGKWNFHFHSSVDAATAAIDFLRDLKRVL